MIAVLPASFSCSAISVHSKPKPGGSTFSAIFSIAAMAWPVEKPRCQLHLHLGRGIEVVARHAVGAGGVAEGRDRADRHHVAVVVARLQVRDVAQRQAVRIVGLRRHPVGAAEDVEVVDVGRAHVDRQRLEDAADRHAELLGLGAVDVGVDLRRVRC